MATSNLISSPRQKLALIIGNNNYNRSESQLRHCINDAYDLSKLLKTINFNVNVNYDLTNAEMVSTLNSFSKTINDGDLVLFYFSGHGYQVNDRNYLMPVNDANIETEDDVEDYAVPVERTIDRFAAKNPSYVTIFILDCCRKYWPKNTVKTKATIEGKGLHTVDPPAGTFIQFACGANRTASDGLDSDRNGLFTKHLLKHITNPTEDIVQIFQGIAADVYNESNRKQKPLSINGLMRRGHIYLNESAVINPNGPTIVSQLAITNRLESNAVFSSNCTQTSVQISHENKPDEINGNKLRPAIDHSPNNTHEQSTSIGSQSIELIRKMLFLKVELQRKPIVENEQIQKTLPLKFESKLLPFQLGKYENLSHFSSVDLQKYVEMIKQELIITTPDSPSNTHGMRVKSNLLKYIGCTCLQQTNSGAFTDALIAKEVHKHLLYLITNDASTEIKMQAARVLGIIFNKATDNIPLSSLPTDTLISLTEGFRANSEETEFKLYLTQVIGEIVIFIAGRTSDNYLVPDFTYQLIGRCLKEGDDVALNHAACKTIENLLLVADKQADKLATSDIALVLWNISSIVGNSEHLRASALAALCHMGLSYPDAVQSAIDKVTIKGDIFSSTSSKVLQYHITLLTILAKRTKNRSMLLQAILPKMNVLYENTNVLIRAKAYNLTYVILSTYNDSLNTLSDTKLFQAIEHDVRPTSADPDENDFLHEAANRLTILFSSLLAQTLDELLFSTEHARKSSSAKDPFRKWLSSFRLISTIIGNYCIRSRVVTLLLIKKLFKIFSNIKLIAEIHSELIEGPSSLSNIISYVSQTLDAFVHARDLLSSFSGIILSDLLPLCLQLLASSINVDEFSRLALCIVNELLNELKLTDCVLPIHIQRDIKQELHQTFLPIIISDRYILREEPIVLFSLRFIQKIWTLIDHTTEFISILLQSKLIPNLFTLITQNKDKPTGTCIQDIISCLNSLSENPEMIEAMIENGLVSIQQQLIQGQIGFLTTDRTIIEVLLELLSLLHRDLTYIRDIAKRALQVKKTSIGDSHLPSVAESLLQVHKPLASLVGPLIDLLPSEDPSIRKIALRNLSLLTQLMGSEGKAILTTNHYHILSSILRAANTNKQKMLLHALKRLIDGNKCNLTVARSISNNELTRTLQQLKKSAITDADADRISCIYDLLHLLM